MAEVRSKERPAYSDTALRLMGSLLLFTQYFYKIRTGRDFEITRPKSREARQMSISRELMAVLRGDVHNLMINIQPGSGKSELLIHFMALSLAIYPDSNFLYISHTKSLAEKHTHTLKQIMELREYKELFDVHLRKDSTAKGHFTTTAGGAVIAFGSAGAIVGHNAGLPGLDRFSGALIIDDPHKPDEVHSDTIRQGVIDNYFETLLSRLRGPNIPVILISQRLHEADLCGEILAGKDGRDWKKLILQTVDERGNNLCPDVISDEQLDNLAKTSEYVYASQYQQTPQPAGGGIFKKDDFVLLEDEPKILTTFITADTAETAKTHNDATVFSFWGLYEIMQFGEPSGIYGLHWIDCLECWVEPRDLKNEFMQFYRDCMRHAVKPSMAAIERKSTGTTLVSILHEIQGLNVFDIERNRSSGSKTQRFLNCQPFVGQKRISLPAYGKHTKKCIEHMAKITKNDSHRYDDIADTCADAIQLALIDKIVNIPHNNGISDFSRDYSAYIREQNDMYYSEF